MPYIGHNRLQILGRFNGTTADDIWTVGLNFGGNLRPEYATAADMPSIAPILATWWDAWSTQLSTGVEMTGFKWNAIGPNGRYVFPEQPNDYEWPVSKKGVQTTPIHPSSACVVMSLYTPLKGKRYRGRIYLPNTQGTLDSSWRLQNAHQLCATATADMIGALNLEFGQAPNGSGVCIIASSYGVNTPVTVVRGGNVLDTQRRRRNRIEEVYYDSPIFGGGDLP